MSFIRQFLLLALTGIIFSATSVPIEDMSINTLGIEYSGGISGQTITKKEVPSRFQAHYLMLHYSPLPFLLVSGGIGGSIFETDTWNSRRFNGDVGFSATGAFELVSPNVFKHVAFNGGLSFSFLNSENSGYKYMTLFYAPSAGALFYIGNILDVNIGAKGHILSGTMKSPSSESSFSNNTNIRGFISLTLHSFANHSYAKFTFDISPESGKDWSYGPNEASFGLQIGYLLRHVNRNHCDSIQKDTGRNLRDIDKMKNAQDKMSEELKECR